MTDQDAERFERILDGLKAEVSSVLFGRRDRLLISQSADPLDQTRDLSELDLDSRQISLLTAKLRSLESALLKIHEGTFGLCDSCEREIPLKRLEAVPWSSLCVACQEIAEARADGPDDTDREADAMPVRAVQPAAKKALPRKGVARRESRPYQLDSPPKVASRSSSGVAPLRNRAPRSGNDLSGAILSRRASLRMSSPPPA